MNKFLVLAILGALMLTTGALAVVDQDIQDINAVVDEVIDISVNNLNFNKVQPGAVAGPQTSVITLGVNNNVNLTVTLSVTDPGTTELFNNLIYDLDGNGIANEDKIGEATPPYQFDVPDDSTFNILAWLDVPAGFVPGPDNGVVQYTAAKDIT